jgi:hypothetical protein
MQKRIQNQIINEFLGEFVRQAQNSSEGIEVVITISHIFGQGCLVFYDLGKQKFYRITSLTKQLINLYSIRIIDQCLHVVSYKSFWTYH